MKKEEITEVLTALGLSCSFQFIPFSASRKKFEKLPSLNYSVTCLMNDKPFFVTAYTMGSRHVPGYRQGDRSRDHAQRIALACESGKIPKKSFGDTFTESKTAILPDIEDVFYSLMTDADALNFRSFEDWADCFGYDEDSRSGEKIYRDCLATGLALRTSIGEAGLEQLRVAFEEY